MPQEYTLLPEPYTANQIVKNGNKVDCVVGVPVNDLIDFDAETLMDTFEQYILDTGILSDIEYDMVGAEPMPVNLIHFRVRAFVENF